MYTLFSRNLAIVGVVVTIATFLVAMAPADAKGSKRSHTPPLKAAAKTITAKCDVKNITRLNGLLKKGVTAKLKKKDLDSARYRYSIAKRALTEKEFSLCLAAIASSKRVLSNARPKPPVPAKRIACSKENFQKLTETIALGDANMFPAKALFSAEAKLAKAKKAFSSRKRRSCRWYIETGMDALEPHRKALAAKKAQITAAVRACPKKNNRNRKYCLRKARGSNRSIHCTALGFKKAERNILTGLKSVKSPKVLRSAEQRYYRAVRAKNARQWKNCAKELAFSLKTISNELTTQKYHACKAKVVAYTTVFARQIADWEKIVAKQRSGTKRHESRQQGLVRMKFVLAKTKNLKTNVRPQTCDVNIRKTKIKREIKRLKERLARYQK